MKNIVECEGAFDRAFVEALRKKGLIGAEVDARPKRGEPGAQGIVGQAKRVGESIHAGFRVVVLRDLDDMEPEDAAKDVVDRVKAAHARIVFEVPTMVGRIARVAAKGDSGTVQVQIVLAGARGSFPELGVGRHATLDDYVLRLLLNANAYGALADEEPGKEVAHAKLVEKIGEMKALLERNEIPATTSAQFVTLACGIVNFRSSRADLVERLIRRAHEQAAFEEAPLHPLLEDLRIAMA